jgi:hypothetical protein
VAVSKRLRFEVFRRDNFTCWYCGGKSPDVELTTDHVVPVALGGKDEPANLVAACEACNSGKTSTTPDAPLVAGVAESALNWAAAMRQAQAKMLADIGSRRRDQAQFEQWWDNWGRGEGAGRTLIPKDANWRVTVSQLTSAGLPLAVLEECVNGAMTRRRIGDENKFRYMCGIAWRKVGDLQKAAQAIAAGAGHPATEEGDEEEGLTRGRADLACELLGWYCDKEEIERLRTEAREDRGAETDDEEHVEAMHVAWQEARLGLSWLGFSVCELLPWIRDEVIETAMRQARADLYDKHGPEFGRAEFAQEVTGTAAKLYEERAAEAYLAAMPAEERAEWVAYANVAFGAAGTGFRGRSAVVMPAECARFIKGGGGAYRVMCRAWGERIPYCPSKATHFVRFNEGECCQDPDDKSHRLCEQHLEIALQGDMKRGGDPLTVLTSRPIGADEAETAVPF